MTTSKYKRCLVQNNINRPCQNISLGIRPFSLGYLLENACSIRRNRVQYTDVSESNHYPNVIAEANPYQ